MRRRRRRRRRRRLERSEGEFGERVRSGALLESGEEKERERERERERGKRKEERGKRKEGARDVSKRRVIGNRKHWREMTLDGERKEKKKKRRGFCGRLAIRQKSLWTPFFSCTRKCRRLYLKEGCNHFAGW